jgi:hypothetical protein
MFYNDKHGFTLKLPNGYAISVKQGSFHYCSNRNFDASYADVFPEANTVEIAVFDPKDEMIQMAGGHDKVIGWVDMERFLEILDHVRGL